MGQLIAHVDYGSFGNILGTENGELLDRFLYSGREYEPETGFYYYRARYFDPQAGRFLSEDPIGFSGGDSNLYRYVSNSPLNGTDPSGLSSSIENRILIGIELLAHHAMCLALSTLAATVTAEILYALDFSAGVVSGASQVAAYAVELPCASAAPNRLPLPRSTPKPAPKLVPPRVKRPTPKPRPLFQPKPKPTPKPKVSPDDVTELMIAPRPKPPKLVKEFVEQTKEELRDLAEYEAQFRKTINDKTEIPSLVDF
jgi:RHS repeat-associated protein